jgi:uncharacterized protein YacL
MKTSLWSIRLFFLLLCTLSGYAVSQHWPEFLRGGLYGSMIGFGLGGLLIAIDEMLKGFSLRAFSAATFGLLLGSLVAWLIDRSELFIWLADDKTRWLIRLCLFLSFGYLGMVLAMRSNKDDFSLIIPYVRFKSQLQTENPIILDTSAIIDGRIADLLEARFVEGVVVVPRFVLKELQLIADSRDNIRRSRGRRGLEMLNRLQKNPRQEVRIHEGEFAEETEVDAKLILLTRALGAKLYTNDYNLGKLAELQHLPCLILSELAKVLRPVVLPGDELALRLVREGKEKGQAVAYLSDGTMVVVNQSQHLIGHDITVQVTSLLPTGAGLIIFAEPKAAEDNK